MKSPAGDLQVVRLLHQIPLRWLVSAAVFFTLWTEAAHPQTANLEQAALDFFYEHYWNEDLFAEECTGLSFDPDHALLVYADSSAYQFGPFALHAAGEMLGFREEEQSAAYVDYLRSLRDGSGPDSVRALILSLDASRKMRATPWREAPPPEEGVPTLEWKRDFVAVKKDFDAYLLLFSSRLQLGEAVFLDLWVRESAWTSGAHVTFRMNANGEVVDHVRRNVCYG